MPSRFEPCGQGQMIALRYGTPPIVRRTGGLGDTVLDEAELPGHGTGFVFDEATPAALLVGLRAGLAFAAPRADGRARRGRRSSPRGMAVDFSWESGPAHGYLAAYRGAVELRVGPDRPEPARSARTLVAPGADGTAAGRPPPGLTVRGFRPQRTIAAARNPGLRSARAPSDGRRGGRGSSSPRRSSRPARSRPRAMAPLASASASPRVFWPNGDGVADTTSAPWTLPGPATVTVDIVDWPARRSSGGSSPPRPSQPATTLAAWNGSHLDRAAAPHRPATASGCRSSTSSGR